MTRKPTIAVIGAGPAGLFATQSLIDQGAHVALLNRDIRPGGLAEYGIYYEKYKIKEGLRKQFRKILDSPDVKYYGNVTVAHRGDITLDMLRYMGFSAILVTAGAQATKWLGLPGEGLRGVYHSKPLIYAYNGLPPFSEQEYHIGKHVALIGVGNVMADIAHWLVQDRQVKTVTAVARRGPAEVKFARNELGYVANNLDLDDLDAEVSRVSGMMVNAGQEPQEAKDFILSALTARTAHPRVSDTQVRFRFMSSPNQMLGNRSGHVVGMEIANNELGLTGDGKTYSRRLGTTDVLDIDTVIYCIGDKVSNEIGLPVAGTAFVKHPHPLYPVKGTSYEVYDPDKSLPITGTFVAGWSRLASTGQVGTARRDAIQASQAVLHYIEAEGITAYEGALKSLDRHLRNLSKPVVTQSGWQRLEAVEQQKAEDLGMEFFKYKRNSDMLDAMVG